MSEMYRPWGVIPANLLPLRSDLTIDETAYRDHLRDLATVRGVTALAVNGHAAEVATLTREERRIGLAIAVHEVGDQMPIISGVYADGTSEAVELARDAQIEGASALLVFPSSIFAGCVPYKPEMIYNHFESIATKVDLPLIAFQYPLRSGLAYSTGTLVELARRVPHVVAIKDWSQDIVVFERNLRALRTLGRPFSVLTTYSQSLLPSLVLGVDGLLSGHGSIIAPLQVEIWEAVQRGDLGRARVIAEQLFILTEVFYAEPFLDMHNRMKEALVMLGKLERAFVRPPLLPINEGERMRIRSALIHAGLMSKNMVTSEAM